MMAAKLFLSALAVFVAWTALPGLADPDSTARLTLLDGEAALIRGARKSAAPLGLRLQDGDIIESSRETGLVRIEFADKRILDLGPDTRVLLRPSLAPGDTRARPYAYVLSGWTKLSTPQNKEGTLLAPSMEALTSGVVLLQVKPKEAFAFAEAGPTQFAARGGASSTVSMPLSEGQFLMAPDRSALASAPRPPNTWIKSVPSALRETLPPRIDRFAGINVPLDGSRDVNLADVEPWIATEPELRNLLQTQWAALLRDTEPREARSRPLPRAPLPELAQNPVEKLAVAPKAPAPAPLPAPRPAAAPAPAPPPAPRPAPAPAPPTAPAPPPAPLPARAAVPPTDADNGATKLLVASFKGIARSAQGGEITPITYAEHAGDAVNAQLSVRDSELRVKGLFVTTGHSAWAGVGVSVNLKSGSFDATGYKMLRIRLNASGTNKLRIRLVGTDKRALQSGCYPIASQTVSANPREYEIPFSRFAPEAFCGNGGVPVTNSLSDLNGIEVVDAASPVIPREVQFGIGNISLLR